jgi:hypothetical protein
VAIPSEKSGNEHRSPLIAQFALYTAFSSVIFLFYILLVFLSVILKYNDMGTIKDFLQRNLTVKHAMLVVIIIAAIFYTSKMIMGKAQFTENNATRCDTCGIGITDLVREVKKELTQLEDSMVHRNENEMFRLKDMEMEISFVVRQTTSGKMGGSYEVVTVEGSRENSNEKVQKLVLHWNASEIKPDTSKHIVSKALDQHYFDSIENLKKRKSTSPQK